MCHLTSQFRISGLTGRFGSKRRLVVNPVAMSELLGYCGSMLEHVSESWISGSKLLSIGCEWYGVCSYHFMHVSVMTKKQVHKIICDRKSKWTTRISKTRSTVTKLLNLGCVYHSVPSSFRFVLDSTVQLTSKPLLLLAAHGQNHSATKEEAFFEWRKIYISLSWRI